MANSRTAPYPAYNYTVSFVNLDGVPKPDDLLGGFSDVSGLSTEIHISEYRNGNESESAVRKVPGSYKVGDVTLKRGVVNTIPMFNWHLQTRKYGIAAQRDVVITMQDESGSPVQKWTLRRAVPMKYTGPTLAGKGGGEVAMEELVLSAEGFEVAPAP